MRKRSRSCPCLLAPVGTLSRSSAWGTAGTSRQGSHPSTLATPCQKPLPHPAWVSNSRQKAGLFPCWLLLSSPCPLDSCSPQACCLDRFGGCLQTERTGWAWNPQQQRGPTRRQQPEGDWVAHRAVPKGTLRPQIPRMPLRAGE